MTAREFELQIIAFLNKQLSKKSINGDLRTLDNTMYVRVIAKLSKTLARKQLKSQLKELNDLYVKIGANVNIDKNAKARLQKNIQMLQQSISDLEIGLKASKYQQNKINAEIKSIRNKLQQDAENHPISFNLQVKKEKLISDLEYVGKRYSKLFSNVSATQKYEKIMSNAFNVSDKWQLADVRAELSAFTSELKANGLATQSTVDKWKTLVDRSKDLFSAVTLVRVVFSQIRESISTFTELDTAMTGVWKVSNDITSREQFSELLTKWNKLAQDLSVTTTSLINSIEEWSKIGFDLDMSEQLAELTTIFEKTAEISNDLANKTLVSTAQAFTQIDGYGEKDYVERVEAIGNKINAVGNKYAISSEGISEALQNSSAALVMANNDLDEAIAMITAGNKIFQSPEEMGNTLKVVSARLRGQKGELEALGEDTEGMIEGVSKVQTQILNLTGNKVNIFESDNETLKSTYDILLEVGKIYDSLSDKDQASLTEIMFGKQRMSSGSSLLLNYEELEQVKNDSINASNSMAEEYAKYMGSTEASITKFKEKLIETYSVFMSGDMIKYAADTASAFLDLVNSTDLLRHSLLAIASINIGKGLSVIGATVISTTKQMNALGNALEQVKNLPLDNDDRLNVLDEIGKSTQNLTEKNLTLLLSQKQLEERDRLLILENHNLTKEEARAKLEKMQLTTATNNQSKANVKEATTTMTLSGAMTSLKTTIQGVGVAIKSSFLNNAVGWVLTGITTAVSIASTAMDNYNQKLEEQSEQIKQTAEESSDHAQSLLDLQKQLDDDTVSAEDLTTAFREQLRAMGYTETEIDKLIDKYGNLAGAIDEATVKALENAKTDAYANVSTSGKSLIADAKGNTNVSTYYSQNAELSEEIQRMLEESPAILDGGVFRMDKDASAEDIYEYYLVLKDISQLIQETANETGDDSLLGDTTPYYQVSEALDALSDSAKSYGDAINRLHSADAQLELSDYLKTNDIDSQDAFDKYIEGIKESTTYSDTYKEVLLEVANDAFPQFSDAIKSASDSISDFTNESENLEELNENINTAYDSISKSYDALQEFKDAMSTGMTDSVLDAVAGLSDELKALVGEFYAGTVSADELFEALTKHYENDLKNYSEAIIAKNQYSEEFYNTIGLNDTELVNHMFKNYKVDISNCKTYAEAKLKIEQDLLGNVAEMWSKYYDSQNVVFSNSLHSLDAEINALEKKKSNIGFSPFNTDGSISNSYFSTADATQLTLLKNLRDNYAENFELYDKAIKELNNITYKGIESSFEGISSKLDKNSSSSKSSKDTEKTFDHIETKLSNMADTLSDLDTKVSDTYSTWTERNNALAQSIAKTNESIELQKRAYETYMDVANSVGLADTYKNLVHNGAMDISVIKDDTLAEQIQTYTDYYEKAQECLKTAEELEKTRNELSISEKWNLFEAESDADIDVINSYIDSVNTANDKLEALGKFADEQGYGNLLSATQNKIEKLSEKATELQSVLATVPQDTEMYDTLFNNLLGIRQEISELENDCIEFNNNIRDLNWEIFEYLEDSISRINDEVDYLVGLLDNEDLFDDKGNRTKYGDATIALHASSYDVYKQQAQDYKEEMLDLQKQLANGNMDVLEQYRNMEDAHRSAIESANDEKQAILDLVQNGYEAQKEALQGVIDKRLELLDVEKSAYDYQKTISDLVEERNTLQKQRLAYQNDKSESGRMNLQQIESKLADVNENLQQTEYEKYLSDTEKMLNTITLEYEEWMNQRLDNENELLAQIVSEVSGKGDEINTTLTEVAEKNGTLISDSITSIFDAESPFTNGLTNITNGVAGTTTAINNLIAQVQNIAGIIGTTNAESGNNAVSQSGSNVPIESSPATNTNSNVISMPVESAPIVTTPSIPQTNTSTSWQDALVHSKYLGNKSNLSTSTSIVDLLKSHDYSAEWNDRANLYYAMGGSGAYTGSAKQNRFMIDKMKAEGYKKGSHSILGNQMNWLHDGEVVLKRTSDGGILSNLPNGSMVFNATQAENLWNLSNMKLVDMTPNISLPSMPVVQSRNVAPNVTVEFGDTNVTLPNVRNPEDFAREFKNVYANNIGWIQNMVRDDVHGASLGRKNEARKYI